jgi:SAM-dependent methyltransferase
VRTAQLPRLSRLRREYNIRVDGDTADQLLALNRQFYQTFAVEFSATRRRLQPGVRRLMARIPTSRRLLDLGCGNGELWRELEPARSTIFYLGLDFSPGLLDAAQPASDDQTAFMQFDLAAADWSRVLAYAPFDLALAFAVLHHLPGEALRLQVLRRVRECLKPQGRFFHSEWQFLNSQRLSARIQPWSRAGIDETRLDPGDYLLDWRSGGEGLRYVHHFSEAELSALAEQAGFAILETFYSDGDGGRLSIYQVWEVTL